jgi:hypothetical protein
MVLAACKGLFQMIASLYCDCTYGRSGRADFACLAAPLTAPLPSREATLNRELELS